MKVLGILYPSWIKKQKNKNKKEYHFLIKDKNLIIGELYTKNENEKRIYIFEYSEEFKEQHSGENAVRKLTGFKEFKTYKSEYLYPFFLSRIPDPNRPIIKEIIEKEGYDKNDPLQLLDRFGKKTLDNSFIVELKK